MPTLRYKADTRTLTFLFAYFVCLALLWTQGFFWPEFVLLMILATSAGPIAHNHAHGGTFKEKWADLVMSWVVSLTYGFAVAVWTPTHLQNHHIYGNRDGDATITWRWTKENTPWMALVYFPLSAWYQNALTSAFLKGLWQKNKKKFAAVASEYVVWGLWVGGALLLDWRKALLYLGVPFIWSLWCVHFFNYVQHVGCDWDAKYNQSRNFVGRWVNALLFNNGLHTIHHLKPGLHWSLAPAAHAEIAGQIHPRLNVQNTVWYLFRTYFLSLFMGPERGIDFTGHPGSVAKLPPAPPPPPSWNPDTIRTIPVT